LSARIGLELGTDEIRAVCLGGWPRMEARGVEVSWDPQNPAGAAEALREHLPPGGRLAIAVGFPLLRVRHLSLPPLPREEKLRILNLEPERFFAVRDQKLVYSLAEDRDLVFATGQDWLDESIRQLEVLGRVEHVEPAPPALARALAGVGVPEALVIQTDGPAGGLGLMQFRAGRVESARRIFGDPDGGEQWVESVAALTGVSAGETAGDRAVLTEATAASGSPVYLLPWSEARAAELESVFERSISPLPSIAGPEASFLTAYGTALAIGQEHKASLMPPAVERRVLRRRRRDLWLAGAAAVAAFALAMSGLDASRARAERRLDDRLAEVRSQATEVLALQTEAESLIRERRELEGIETQRPRPLEVLLAVSQLLPPDAHVRAIRMTRSGWEIDGYARDAAALVPVLDDHSEFEDVRFRSATTRAQVGNQAYESFSLALRHVSAP
jgi:Tfp pilus assembly protein PilN